jgi:hypothetical protein
LFLKKVFILSQLPNYTMPMDSHNPISWALPLLELLLELLQVPLLALLLQVLVRRPLLALLSLPSVLLLKLLLVCFLLLLSGVINSIAALNPFGIPLALVRRPCLLWLVIVNGLH